MNASRKNRTEQQGIILLVTLVFLLVLAVVAYSATNSTVLSEKISGNQWEYDRAYQAAESALIDGSSWLYSIETLDQPEGDSSASNGIWETGSLADYLYDPNYDWSDAKIFGADTGAATAVFSVNNAIPRYLVENVGWSTDDASPENASAGFITFYYGVSSVGFGKGEASRVALQSISAKRYR